RLPPAAIGFYLRALRLGRRSGDTVSLAIAARPRELSELLRAARGAVTVAEVGTGTGWTAIVLALAQGDRHVHSFDVGEHEQRARYLELAPPDARARLHLAIRDGREGPPPGLHELDFLFIDSSHELEETVTTFSLWSERLRQGATVAFHDYGDEHYPGVAQAVAQLGLDGQERAGMYLWRKPGGV
ncbi:MAG: class I SAM-dependent methyltransferase, partial [Pseudonocardiaceae bacterium]